MDSYVIADNLQNVILASLDSSHGGTKFGFLFHTSATKITVEKKPPLSYVIGGPTEQTFGADFVIRKV